MNSFCVVVLFGAAMLIGVAAVYAGVSARHARRAEQMMSANQRIFDQMIRLVEQSNRMNRQPIPPQFNLRRTENPRP